MYNFSLNVNNVTDRTKLSNIIDSYELLKYVFDMPEFQDDRASFQSWEDQRWMSCREDMLHISQELPECVFELTIISDTGLEFWKEYYLNGEVEVCDGKVVYTKPKNIKWSWPEWMNGTKLS